MDDILTLRDAIEEYGRLVKMGRLGGKEERELLEKFPTARANWEKLVVQPKGQK